MITSRRSAALARGVKLIAMALLALGCAGTNQSVQALRQFAFEDPPPETVSDRVADLDRSVLLIDRILLGTPYSEGDEWAVGLALDERRADVLREQLRQTPPYRDRRIEIPVLKLLILHVEQTLPPAGIATATSGRVHPSLFAAMAKSFPELGDTTAQFARLRAQSGLEFEAVQRVNELEERYPTFFGIVEGTRPPALIQAQEQAKQSLLSLEKTQSELKTAIATAFSEPAAAHARLRYDLMSSVSVATRIAREALAFWPVVTAQAVRSLSPGSMGALGKSPGDVVILPRLERARSALAAELAVLEPLSERLAEAERRTVDDTPGFRYRESLVDELAGITWRSLHLRAAAGGEALYYSALADEEKTSDSNSNVDYTGRQFRLDYDVEPIVLASAGLTASLDWLSLQDALGLKLQFATDRVYRSGGEIESRTLSEQVGAQGLASDVLEASLAAFGVSSKVRVARFTTGTVDLVQVSDGSVVASAPLRFNMTSLDLGYDFVPVLAPKSRAFLEEATVSFRYFDYSLPRLLYELRDQTPESDTANYTFVRESPPQRLQSIYYMGGFDVRAGEGLRKVLSPYVDLGLHVGAGPTRYYFLADPNLPDTAGNRQRIKTTATAIDATFGVGIRYRVHNFGPGFYLFVDAAYRGELIRSILDSEEEDTGVFFGGTDVFHGPRLSLAGGL